MPILLHRVPLVGDLQAVTVGGIPLTFKRYQPVAWARLVPWGSTVHPDAVPFPVVIDSGLNDAFLIRASQVRAWSKLEPEDYVGQHAVRSRGVAVKCYRFNVELFRLRAGNRTDVVAGRLQTDKGVAVVPPELESLFPEIPTLGVRAMVASRATFTVDGGGKTFSLRTPGPPATRRNDQTPAPSRPDRPPASEPGPS